MFDVLRGRVDARAVPDDFAVFLRRRAVDLAPADRPLTDDDLATIAGIGRRRAEAGLSLDSQQRMLAVHTGLLLREIHDAAGTDDVGDLLRATWKYSSSNPGSLA